VVPHKPSQERGGGRCCTFDDRQLESDFLRCAGDGCVSSGASTVVPSGGSLLTLLFRSLLAPELPVTGLPSRGSSTFENQFNQLMESLLPLIPSDDLFLCTATESLLRGSVVSGFGPSACSSAKLVFLVASVFRSCELHLNFAACPFCVASSAELTIFEVTFCLVVVAAKGKALLELAMFNDK